MTAITPGIHDLIAAKAFFGSNHPLFSAFGIEVEDADANAAVMSMPCSENMCDSRGALHRGAIATLLDTTCGLAIFARLGDMRPIATIDLRLDFITDPVAGEGVRSKVECIAVAGDLAYVRGTAWSSASDSLLASVSGSFAIGTLGPAFDRAMEKARD